FNKILERLIFNRLYKFIEDNNILSGCQYGFRRGFSTEMAPIDATEHISKSLD
ncbi:hypothetical protein CAPTEDRAFT_118121, partial [Capitella teleta]